jgi:NitT/TauT family transport system permease protein
MRNLLPILTVLSALLLLWYAAVVPMNAQWTRDQAARAGVTLTAGEIIADTMAQDRPRLPAPHQVAAELWNTTGAMIERGRAFSKRSLIYHGWVTLSATLLGFALGTGLGILLAVGIVHNRAMDMSVMPWAIASQMIPILALAPMIIVVLIPSGCTGLIPKAIISAYLAFFPVVVGMVKGLRSPEAAQLDLLRTYSTPAPAEFWRSCACRPRCPISSPRSRSRWPQAWWAPSSASCRPARWRGWARACWRAPITGRRSRSGRRSFGAAILAALLLALIGLIQRVTLRRMGMAQ